MPFSNTEKYRQWITARREVVRQFVCEYLSNHPCVDCGEDDIVVLDFDHVRGKKTRGVSQMVQSAGYTLKRIAEEIEKCDIRCANCHRRRTDKVIQEQYGGSSKSKDRSLSRIK